MFRKRWLATVDAAELRERMKEVQRAAEAEGFRLELVGAHHCGGSEETILYSDRSAEDRSKALCLQLDLNPPWGGGSQAILVWGARRPEVVSAGEWLRGLGLVRDDVPPPQKPLRPNVLFDFGLCQIGHLYRPEVQAVLSEALLSKDPELREAACRVIGIFHIHTALPELAAALEREERPQNRALFADALSCLVGDAVDVRWLDLDFEAACARVMVGMPEEVALTVVEPGAQAWGGEPHGKSFELRAYRGIPGVALEVYHCPQVQELLPVGLPKAELPISARVICEPRFSVEGYVALEAALAEATDPRDLLLAADDAMQRSQTWPLRPLAEHAHRFAPDQQAEIQRLLALPQLLPGLDGLTPLMLLAGLLGVP